MGSAKVVNQSHLAAGQQLGSRENGESRWVGGQKEQNMTKQVGGPGGN